MAQKTYAKHSEYKTYSTKGTFDDKGFDSMKAELLPAKYGSLIQPGNGAPGKKGANKEFYYEYKEEKNPAGTYDRKDLHTVEQYDFNNAGDSGYNYNSPPRITNTTVTTTTNRDLSHNIEELDSLLDDLQKDQERKLYKSGYTSDVMESSSFDYKPTTPLKSTGYSSLSRVERDLVSAAPTVSREVNREVVRNYVTESHVIPSHVSPVAPQSVPAVVCGKCQGHSNTGTPMNKVTTTVKTYTYEVPADQDPTTIPIPGTTPPNTSVSEKYLTTDRNYIQENHENRTYANTHFNTSTPVKQPPPPPSPQPGCQYCSHCNSCITTTKTTALAGSPLPQHHHHPSPHGTDTTKVTTRTTHYTTSTAGYPDNKGPPYPNDHSPTYAIPVDNTPRSNYPPNQGSPPGPIVYKHTTTNYTTYNTPDGRGKPGPFPAGNLSPPTSPSPFPRTESPAPGKQEPPKRLDELMADFPGHENYRTDHDGLRMRPNPARGPGGSINGNMAVRETAQVQTQSSKGQEMVATPSKNVQGAAVYYPPGHEMFPRREESAAYQQAGGGYMKGKGKYQYEAESRSKSKSSSSTSKDVVCLPLCCAMPCVLL